MKKMATMEANPNKKILFIVSHYALGGAEKYVEHLAPNLPHHLECHVFAVKNSVESAVGNKMISRLTAGGVKVHKALARSWKSIGWLTSALRLKKIFDEVQPDIVHLNTEVPEFCFTLCTIMFPSTRRVRIVRTIHNTNLWPKWKLVGYLCEFCLRKAKVVCVSETVKKAFVRWRIKLSLLPPDDCAVIYNPIDVREGSTDISSNCATGRKVRLLFAGRLEYQKGFDLVPEILNATQLDSSKLDLTIIGSGSGVEIARSLVTTPPKGWDVHLEEPTADLVNRLCEFDVLLFPSRFEGFGRLAAEALMCGVPVVAFDLVVLEEVFPPDYPWLAAPMDVADFSQKLIHLMSSLDEAQPTVKKAKDLLLEKTSPERVVRQHWNLYNKEIAAFERP